MRPVLAVVAALLLGACASPRNSLNTAASACFRGLPAAGAAVDHQAKLIGVRRVRRTELVGKVPEAARIAPAVLCLVAYRGPFHAGDVPGADPPGPGEYAMVALDPQGAHVLGTFVVAHLPLRFGTHRS
jgi:hypothetical protein